MFQTTAAESMVSVPLGEYDRVRSEARDARRAFSLALTYLEELGMDFRNRMEELAKIEPVAPEALALIHDLTAKLDRLQSKVEGDNQRIRDAYDTVSGMPMLLSDDLDVD